MLELPRLDNKPYHQLLDEAVAKIPTLTKEWTDFNPQDTGIMLLELCAAMTESQMYYLDWVGEELINRYIALIEGQDAPGGAEGFAQRNASIQRAVTAGDYRTLALEGPLALSRAQATQDGLTVTLTVAREGRPLTGHELDELRSSLEPCRMLGVSLMIEQAVCREVDVDCRVRLNSRAGRASLVRERLARLFELYVDQREMGEEINHHALRTRILALPEIAAVTQLSIRGRGEDSGERACWIPGRFRVVFES